MKSVAKATRREGLKGSMQPGVAQEVAQTGKGGGLAAMDTTMSSEAVHEGYDAAAKVGARVAKRAKTRASAHSRVQVAATEGQDVNPAAGPAAEKWQPVAGAKRVSARKQRGGAQQAAPAAQDVLQAPPQVSEQVATATRRSGRQRVAGGSAVGEGNTQATPVPAVAAELPATTDWASVPTATPRMPTTGGKRRAPAGSTATAPSVMPTPTEHTRPGSGERAAGTTRGQQAQVSEAKAQLDDVGSSTPGSATPAEIENAEQTGILNPGMDDEGQQAPDDMPCTTSQPPSATLPPPGTDALPRTPMVVMQPPAAGGAAMATADSNGFSSTMQQVASTPGAGAEHSQLSVAVGTSSVHALTPAPAAASAALVDHSRSTPATTSTPESVYHPPGSSNGGLSHDSSTPEVMLSEGGPAPRSPSPTSSGQMSQAAVTEVGPTPQVSALADGRGVQAAVGNTDGNKIKIKVKLSQAAVGAASASAASGRSAPQGGDCTSFPAAAVTAGDSSTAPSAGADGLAQAATDRSTRTRGVRTNYLRLANSTAEGDTPVPATAPAHVLKTPAGQPTAGGGSRKSMSAQVLAAKASKTTHQQEQHPEQGKKQKEVRAPTAVQLPGTPEPVRKSARRAAATAAATVAASNSATDVPAAVQPSPAAQPQPAAAAQLPALVAAPATLRPPAAPSAGDARIGIYTNRIMERHELMTDDPELKQKECAERIKEIHRTLDMLVHRCHTSEGRQATRKEITDLHDEKQLETFLKTCSSVDVNVGKIIWSKTNVEIKQVEPGQGFILDKRSDTYFVPGTAESVFSAVGTCTEAWSDLLRGKIDGGFCVVRPPAHHATGEHSMGFCFFNGPAVAVEQGFEIASKLGVEYRPCVLDWDIHQGNGTQEVYKGDKRVLNISLHRQANGAFYPWEGTHSEATYVGEGDGEGKTMNCAWQLPGAGTKEYLAVFFRVILPALRDHRITHVMICAGFDAVKGDPLGGCEMMPQGYALLTQLVAQAVHGNVLQCLEGGYNTRATADCVYACVDALLTKHPHSHPTPDHSQQHADTATATTSATSGQSTASSDAPGVVSGEGDPYASVTLEPHDELMTQQMIDAHKPYCPSLREGDAERRQQWRAFLRAHQVDLTSYSHPEVIAKYQEELRAVEERKRKREAAERRRVEKAQREAEVKAARAARAEAARAGKAAVEAVEALQEAAAVDGATAHVGLSLGSGSAAQLAVGTTAGARAKRGRGQPGQGAVASEAAQANLHTGATASSGSEVTGQGTGSAHGQHGGSTSTTGVPWPATAVEAAGPSVDSEARPVKRRRGSTSPAQHRAAEEPSQQPAAEPSRQPGAQDVPQQPAMEAAAAPAKVYTLKRHASSVTAEGGSTAPPRKRQRRPESPLQPSPQQHCNATTVEGLMAAAGTCSRAMRGAAGGPVGLDSDITMTDVSGGNADTAARGVVATAGGDGGASDMADGAVGQQEAIGAVFQQELMALMVAAGRRASAGGAGLGASRLPLRASQGGHAA